MISTGMVNPMAWAWAGAILLLFGETAALLSLPNLVRVVLVSTVAEIGYVLMGLGLGGAAGDTGAFMHIGYQVAMRGLVVVAGWYLVARNASVRLDDLAGSGRRMPMAATLFGFGMFSVAGLSPFKGSYSKFLILYAAIEQGHWALAAVGTLASIIASAYYLLVVQRVCFEQAPGPARLQRPPAGAMALALVLAAITAVISLWPDPIRLAAEHFAAGLGAVANAGSVPEFDTPWPALVLVPYLGGFALFAIGHFSARARDTAAVLLALATLALACLAGPADPAAHLFAMLFAGIFAVMVVYSVGYMAHGEYVDRYYFFAFLMAGSMLGLTTSRELGGFYVFWELMTWTSYFLVIHDQTPRALRAGFVYFMMCAAGAYVMHFGILVVHARVGSFALSALAAAAPAFPPTLGIAVTLCFLAGFLVKAGVVPLHAWLPVAHPEAPSPVSGPLSAILTAAGVFGVVHVVYGGIGLSALARFAVTGVSLHSVLIALGCTTLLYGEIRALLEKELKRMLAFSTIAQIGEVMAVLGIGTALAVDGALLHTVNHAVMKTLLFYAAGAFILRVGLKRIDDFAGLGRKMPFTAGCYALASFAIMGLPPFGGFVSKFLMIYAAAQAGYWPVATILLLGGIIGVVYYTRVVATLFYRSYAGPLGVREAPAAMCVANGLLAAGIVVAGVAPGWLLGKLTPIGAEIAAQGGGASPALPNLIAAWPASAALVMLGAVAVLLVGRHSVVWAGRLAVAVLAAAVVAVALRAGQVDMLSLGFGLLIAGVGALNMLHSTAYLAHSHAQGRFYAAFMVMIAGLLGLVVARDLFTFFAFWELMSSWALWAAIAHEETAEARGEAFKYFFFNTIGASFLFIGIAALAAFTGATEFTAVAAALPGLSTTALAGTLVPIFLGLVMKAAMLPFRIDIQMHPALAPTPVSGYISAVLLKSGPWGVLKLFTVFGGAALFARLGGTVANQPVFLEVISVIAGITVVYAGAMAMLQNGIKLLLIYSTVCQLGYVLMALSFGTSLGVAGGLLHLVNHMLLKDTLFLAAGAVMAATHATMLDELGGLGKRMPLTFGFFLFAGLSLSGVPPLNGFVSKWIIFEAAFQSGHWLLGAAAMVASLFTLAAILKFAYAAFMGAPTTKALAAREAPLAMLVPMGILTVASVIAGLFPGGLLVPIATIETELGLEPITVSLGGPLPGALDAGWNPTLLGVVLVLIALLLVPWQRLGRGVQRGGLHSCGVADIPSEATRMGTAGLFESPVAAARRLKEQGS
jgi:formate hydrogenlyase subunit 3/multisubunit Na+/H+ antiporter MnhD subunit